MTNYTVELMEHVTKMDQNNFFGKIRNYQYPVDTRKYNLMLWNNEHSTNGLDTCSRIETDFKWNFRKLNVIILIIVRKHFFLINSFFKC
jgi:hypothetical protein